MANFKITTTVKYFFFFLTLALGTMSCSDECEDETPRCRIINNGTGKASVQIKTSGGNTENINNIEVGQSSDWRSFAAGNTEFTVAIQGVTGNKIISVNMENCWEYDINIDANNNIVSTPRKRE